MTTEYWGVPLWGWILIVVVLGGLVVGIRGAMTKRSEPKTDVENTGVGGSDPVKLQEFPRDAPLPMPAPSETSERK